MKDYLLTPRFSAIDATILMILTGVASPVLDKFGLPGIICLITVAFIISIITESITVGEKNVYNNTKE